MAAVLADGRTNEGAIVDRRGGVQLWRQIADRMRQSLAAGDFGEAGMMPSEAVLAKTYSVNRHTIRAALAVLAREGLLQPQQGKGTLILRRERLTYPIGRRTRFSQGLAGQVEKLDLTLQHCGTMPATPDIAERLGIDAALPCTTLETLGTADGQPLSLASHVFAPGLERMPDAFRDTGSITKALAALGIPDYVRLSTEVTGRIASPLEASALALSPGAIILETLAVNGLPDGKPFQLSRTCFPADRIKLSLTT